MSSTASLSLTAFAQDVLNGLSEPVKSIPARCFYDDLGSALFEAITFLPEYGLTRADERLLQRHAGDLATKIGNVTFVSELGSGSGRKTRLLLEALGKRGQKLTYSPIDVSQAALSVCERELNNLADVKAICDEWNKGLQRVARRRSQEPILLLFLGSTVGNLERQQLPAFLSNIHRSLRPGDYFLLGADLVKDVEVMLSAYDDPTGVTAAFNLNVLGRMNRELGAEFDLRSFTHEVRWNSTDRRIEMHLLSGRTQSVFVAALERSFHFEAGETIWTESSHKFSEDELTRLAGSSGFETLACWTDSEWPFAESLWQVT